jgi:hypothetical protein
MTISFYQSLHANFWTKDTFAPWTITVVNVQTWLESDESDWEPEDQTGTKKH